MRPITYGIKLSGGWLGSLDPGIYEYRQFSNSASETSGHLLVRNRWVFAMKKPDDRLSHSKLWGTRALRNYNGSIYYIDDVKQWLPQFQIQWINGGIK